MLLHVILDKLYEENPASSVYVVGKKEDYFKSLNNCEYSSLIIYQNSTSGSFFKVSCSIQS